MEVDGPLAVDRAICIIVECCKKLPYREIRGSISTAAIEVALLRGRTDYESAQLAGICHAPPLVGIPAELETIVRTALAKDPEMRYQTPGQLAVALTDYLVARDRS